MIDCDERPGHRLLGARSEHHWLRLCHGRLGHLFPYLPNQPGYHKRVKKAAPLLAAVTGHLARQSPCWYDPVRLIDATPGAVRHLAGDRPPRRAGRAGALWILRGALALVLGAEAVPDHHPGRDAGGVVPGRSSLGEREAAAELLAHAARTGALRPGLTLIGDKGFAGRSSRAWSPPGTGCGWSGRTAATRRPRHGSIGWIRQWIESVNDTLKGQLDLERHGGRTTAGIYTRVAQQLLAMAVCIWHNWAAANPSSGH